MDSRKRFEPMSKDTCFSRFNTLSVTMRHGWNNTTALRPMHWRSVVPFLKTYFVKEHCKILSELSSLPIANCSTGSSTCSLSRRLSSSADEGRQRSCMMAFEERDLPGHYEWEPKYEKNLLIFESMGRFDFQCFSFQKMDGYFASLGGHCKHQHGVY